MKLPILSHSFLATYERCPKQAYHKHILKDIPFEETKAIKWGNEVHKALELAINENKPLPTEMGKYAKYLSALGDGCTAELSLGITSEGHPCDFWDEACWFRGKLDVLKLNGDAGFILDWKTGRPWEDPSELERHGILAMVHFDYLNRIVGAYAWLKEDRIGKTYELNPTKTVKQLVHLDTQIKQLADEGKEWPARQNPLCGWCPIKDCRYNPERT